MIWLASVLIAAASAADPWWTVGRRLVVTEVRADLVTPTPDEFEGHWLSPNDTRAIEALLEREVIGAFLGRIEARGSLPVTKFRLTVRTQDIKPRRTPTQARHQIRLTIPAELRVFFVPSALGSKMIPLVFEVYGKADDLSADLSTFDGAPLGNPTGDAVIEALIVRGCGPLLARSTQ